MSPSRRREAIEQVRRVLPVSERRTCQVLGQHRSTQRHPPKDDADEQWLRRASTNYATGPVIPGSPSPHRYVMARRLELARRLMIAYDLSIKQIASRCGFYDQSHLTRLYRARYGITPRLSQLEQDVEAEV